MPQVLAWRGIPPLPHLRGSWKKAQLYLYRSTCVSKRKFGLILSTYCVWFLQVHLVSEHIWCDDYLVRSFYLKNVRTGETRTVTQFHFQSWPENGVPSSTKALLEFRRYATPFSRIFFFFKVLNRHTFSKYNYTNTLKLIQTILLRCKS